MRSDEGSGREDATGEETEPEKVVGEERGGQEGGLQQRLRRGGRLEHLEGGLLQWIAFRNRSGQRRRRRRREQETEADLAGVGLEENGHFQESRSRGFVHRYVQ